MLIIADQFRFRIKPEDVKKEEELENENQEKTCDFVSKTEQDKKESDISPAFAKPSGIRDGRGIEINGRFEAEMPLTSVGPPSGGRAALMTPMHSLYTTRPHGLVQAIFWHTCPDLDLSPRYCLPH